jgi:glycosyltransferase involved in cell wall biosynthesis
MVSNRIRRHPATHALNFLGHLPKERMEEEFRCADIFVLPTLAEGSASVVYEALAFGVPAITTQSAGSVVTHGKEGLIVPERDSDAIATAIEKIVRNRGLRAAMAEAALATAANFDEGPWGNRLVEALTVLADDSL